MKFEIRNSKFKTNSNEQSGRGLAHQFLGKAAEDSRTPKPCGTGGAFECARASWSAAVLCRFNVVRLIRTVLLNSFIEIPSDLRIRVSDFVRPSLRFHSTTQFIFS